MGRRVYYDHKEYFPMCSSNKRAASTDREDPTSPELGEKNPKDKVMSDRLRSLPGLRTGTPNAKRQHGPT